MSSRTGVPGPAGSGHGGVGANAAGGRDEGGDAAANLGVLVVRPAPVDLSRLAVMAARLARSLLPGDLVLLEGPLGAGKTALVRMVAEALGVTDGVRSPSFTIANTYQGRVTINHLDLYRLDGEADEDVFALEEYLTPDAVTFVEWPETARHRLIAAEWVIRMDHDTPDTRLVAIEARDEGVAARWGTA